ncbi:hypothetical protein EMPS_01707 [Entomortierella parvispora]|uniref:Uncharacterized protein n=1 Tax=Entomortierella parvispora TaxID=205924 RepID=A0A9P3H3D8_9FUNG|nr:hypothetical protein EMPS_01707 [Entomortierella parvispora]
MPKEETTTAKPKPKTTEAAKPTKSAANPAKTTVAKGTGTETGAPAVTTTLSISPTATPSPAPASGLSGGAIGGIVGGVVVVAALVGLVFYKRRKRAIGAKDGSNPDDKNEPMYLNASNYSNKKGRRSSNNGISAPLALTAEAGVAPSPFPPPISPTHRDDRYGPPPGAGPYGRPSTHSDRNRYGDDDRGQRRGPGNDYYPGGAQHQRNNSHGFEQARHQPPPPAHDEYYDVGLDQEYFGGPPPHNATGAQKAQIASREVSTGTVTPVPEYYLGKEDIDPRRDLRGMDSPENYIKDKKTQQGPPHPPPANASPRSSFSSDGGSAYMTLEQAQKAHNQKMMGHKESISSVDMLIDHSKEQRHQQSPLMKNSNADPKAEPLRSPVTPSFAPDNASIAISESTMSMMPSLPPTTSPQAIGPQHRKELSGHARQGSDPRLQNKSSSGNIQTGGPKGPGSGPLSPLSHDDPYAESAYSEDYGDGRSMISGQPASPYGPGPSGMHHPQHQHPGGSRPYSPYPPQPHHGYGPSGGPHGGYPQGNGGYRPHGPPGGGYPGGPGPYNKGYNGRPQQPMRGHPGPGGYGGGPPHGRPGPGPGPGPGYGGPGPGGYRGGPPPNNNYPPQGYPGRVASPGPGGYRPHPQQQMRDPGYQRAY